jgi:DNA-binding transcriptional ArsR family regulator
MHLVPEDRAHRRPIDEHTVCAAIEGIGDAARVSTWSARFALLGEPGRLSVLLAVHHAAPIAVSDLSIATGISDTAVSQVLRLLRASGTVAADKDGRVVRYRLVDPQVAALLDALPGRDGPPESAGDLYVRTEEARAAVLHPVQEDPAVGDEFT